MKLHVPRRFKSGIYLPLGLRGAVILPLFLVVELHLPLGFRAIFS